MEDLIRNFGIDWKLLLAQAVNFFILLLLLQKFAYKPILKVLRKRREEIEKGLRFTKNAEEKLGQIEKEKDDVLKKARTDGIAIVKDAEKTGRERKEEAAKEATRKSEEIILAAKRLIEEEKTKMGEDVLKNAEELLRIGVAKVLQKIPSDMRDRELIHQAMNELKTMR